MNEIDMSMFTTGKSDQLNADDLIGGPLTIKIAKVTAQPDVKEQPVNIHYEGDGGRPYKPCLTMRRLIMGAWGKLAANYVGRSMTLYRDPTVAFGGMQVGGIRISHMSDIDGEKTLALQVTRGRKAPFKIKPLKAAPQQRPAAEPETDVFGLAPVVDGPAAPSKAEKWTNDYVEAIGRCDDIDALMGLQSRSAETLAKLKAESPDLHGRAVEAGVKRAAELQESAEV